MAAIAPSTSEQTTKSSKGKPAPGTRQYHVHSAIPLASITTLTSSSCPTTSSSCLQFHRHHYHPHNSSKKTSSIFSSAALSKRRGSASSSLFLSWWACLLLSTTILFSSSSCGQAEAKHAWERPGCHKVGHTRKVSIPDCVEFTITTNACRGYCESFAVPSAWYRLQNNPSQAITSVGQCCNIMETEDVTVNVMCVEGQKELVFKSAKSCACYHCKKD